MRYNILANAVGRFWGTISGFLLLPLYISYLGFQSYSFISFTLIIVGLLAILDVGVTATLSRELARADKCHNEKVQVFNTLEWLYWIVVGLCVVLTYLQADVITEKWLGMQSHTSNETTYFLRIIILDAGLQLVMRFYVGGLLGLEKQVKANVYLVAWGIFRNGFVIFALSAVPTLEVFFVWQVIVSAIFAVFARGALCNELTGTYFHFEPKIHKFILLDVWRFAAGMFFIALVAGVNSQLDKLTISKLLSLDILGYYTLAVSLAMGLVLIVNPISMAILPRFTRLYSVGRYEEAGVLFYKVNLYVAILIFCAMSNIVFSAEQLIWVWTGSPYLAMNAGAYLPIISVSYAMLALAILPYTIAIANGYTILNNILGLFSLLVTIPGYWLVTKEYGAIGAAYVYCTVQTGTTMIYLYFVHKKFLPNTVTVSELYLKRIALPFFLACSIAYGFSLIPEWAADNRVISFIQIGFSTCCTIAITTLMLVPIKDLKSMFRVKTANA
jgi:O-antigen/teichoic acid export membrane protein